MDTFILDPNAESRLTDTDTVSHGPAGSTLIQSAVWYTKVRWIAALIFGLVALLFLLPFPFGRRLGIVPQARPMWLLAGFLSIGNIPFWLAVRRMAFDAPRRRVKRLLWGQIGLDLLAVTYLVHTVGSVDSFIAFFYLLHITLSCLALSRNESLIVAIISSVLYLGTVALELTGIWPQHAILRTSLASVRGAPALAVLSSISAVFLWFVIWYFISTLAVSLRRRERQLQESNLRLTKVDQERNRIMIQTAHDLKTPFFGIESNIRLLKEQWWTILPEASRRIMERIDALTSNLRARIHAILLYNEVRSSPRHEDETEVTVDLKVLIDTVVAEVEHHAAERKVPIEKKVPSITVSGNERQLGVLFTNLVANAVAYSQSAEAVTISAHVQEGNAVVSVRDRGIGIRADALPHIFDDYFRTKEAARVNRLSTGLGLAIVREIAKRYSLPIRVDSEEGNGTTFTVIIRRPSS